MNACIVLPHQVQPTKGGKEESFKTRNDQTMPSLEDLFHFSSKSSPSRSYSSPKIKRAANMMVSPSSTACSAASLVEVSLSSSSSPTKQKTPSILLQSSISSNEDGTEVVLCDRESNRPLITPRKLNLLDIEMTPSPLKTMRSSDEMSHSTPRKVSFCGLVDCHSYSPMAPCTRTSAVSDSDDDDTVHMQHQIAAILSIPSYDNIWFGYWQTWGLGCDDEHPNGDAKEAKRNIQRVLKNRAFDLNAKHQRLASLRKDLSPFSVTNDSRCNTHGHPKARSRSYTGMERRRSKSATRTAATPEKSTDIPFLQRALSCGLGHHESPVFVKSHKEEIFYDSDPEDFTSRYRYPRDGAAGDKENAALRMSRTVSLRHDDQVAALVQEMMNEQLTLMLHENTASAKQLRPCGVQCWIERGQQLRNSIIAPKFFWKSIQTPNQQAPNGVFSSVNLMDISRVLPATSQSIDRKLFPFCKPKHAFFIKTLDQSLLLEANSSAERDRIVKSLRLVVARLGSLLLTNNDRLADEYFAFIDQGQLGPGEEPYWLATV